MPWTYRHAGKEWRVFLDDAKRRMDVESDNVAYTAIDGVFRTFRRRLTPQQALDVARLLPAVPRAIFVQDWTLADPEPWNDRAALTSEVQALRRHHNLAPESAIEAVAYALRRSIRQDLFDAVLARIGPEAEAFWHVEVSDPAELEQRII